MTPPSSAATERFLVTGACGCIGAWVIRLLLDEGTPVVGLDVSEDQHRLALLLSGDELARLDQVHVDITDLEQFERTLDQHGITNVIHLAALQVPFCRADPPAGALVNVVGTVNVLESIARRQDRMAPLVYASSVAAFGAVDPDDASATAMDAGTPGTLYGVYKRANEATAAVYWHDRGLMSIGLRPHTVYGLGRDRGLTSAPTHAMVAAAAGAAFQIPFGGHCQFQYAPDVASAFLHASRARVEGAAVHNLPGRPVHMQEIVDAIEAAAPESAGSITYVEQPLPFPSDVDAASWIACFGEPHETPVRVGVAATVDRLRALIADGRVSVEGGAPAATTTDRRVPAHASTTTEQAKE